MYRDVSAKAVRTSVFTTPSRRDKATGGHAMLVVGWKYINGKVHFILLNSWGNGVGDKALFYMPASYVHSGMVMDMWTVPSSTY